MPAPADPTTLGGVLALGFALGLRHALDVDHLAAVSTIVGRGAGVWRSTLVGAAWGLGHTASLLAVACVVIAFQTAIPPAVARLLELGVAVMLVALGVRLLHRVARGGFVHVHVHEHGGRVHAHPHLHAPGAADHRHGPGHGRPFAIGLVHGLAGGGGLMLAVAATIRDDALAVAYVAVFGAGSIAGMALMSTLFAIPMRATTHRFAGAERWVSAGAALASLVVGAALAWTLGREVGLFA